MIEHEVEQSRQHESNATQGKEQTLHRALRLLYEIRERLNCLAVNSSIEASRSMTHTEVFSHVAEQIQLQGSTIASFEASFEREMQNYMLIHGDTAAASVACTTRYQALWLNIQLVRWARHLSQQFWLRQQQNSPENFAALMQRIVNGAKLSGAVDYGEFWVGQDQTFRFQPAQSGTPQEVRPPRSLLQNCENGFLLSNQFSSNETGIWLIHLSHCPKREETEMSKSLLLFFNLAEVLKELNRILPLRVDGTGIVTPTGHAVTQIGESVQVENLSWLRGYRHLTSASDSGYSRESAKNGQSCGYGFARFELNSVRNSEMVPITLLHWTNTQGAPHGSPVQLSSSFQNMHKSLWISALERQHQYLSDFEGLAHQVIQISEQMNIIGVNAAIQAAAASQDGRAFTIVADQIGRLSQDCLQFEHQVFQLMNDERSELCSRHENFISSLRVLVVGAFQRELDGFYSFIHGASVELHRWIQQNKNTEGAQDYSLHSYLTQFGGECGAHHLRVINEEANEPRPTVCLAEQKPCFDFREEPGQSAGIWAYLPIETVDSAKQIVEIHYSLSRVIEYSRVLLNANGLALELSFRTTGPSSRVTGTDHQSKERGGELIGFVHRFQVPNSFNESYFEIRIVEQNVRQEGMHNQEVKH